MKDSYHASLYSDFTCIHCHNFVAASGVMAGVNNRNHCPYCLWSRHLDWRQAGDRLSACKGPMQPIGLSVKKIRKKYGRYDHGELMLVHRCIYCGKVAINRIAGDDDSLAAVNIYESSFKLDQEARLALLDSGIQLLWFQERAVVEAQLFGGWDTEGFRKTFQVSMNETCGVRDAAHP